MFGTENSRLYILGMLAPLRCSRMPTRYPKNSYHNPKKITNRHEMSYFFSFYIDHVTPRCLVIGKRADKKFQERRYWFLAAPFSDPIRLRFCPLESFAIASTAHSHTHIPFDTCIFIPPPRFHGEISGLERATPSNCALWKRRVFEKYRWKNSIPVFRNLREVFNIKCFHYDFYFYVSWKWRFDLFLSCSSCFVKRILSIGRRKEDSLWNIRKMYEIWQRCIW